MSLWLFTVVVNLVVIQYASGVVKAAVDEAARTGAVWGVAECRTRIGEVVGGLLGGPYGAGLAGDCVVDGRVIRARVAGILPGLVPPVPDLGVEAEGEALVEDP